MTGIGHQGRCHREFPVVFVCLVMRFKYTIISMPTKLFIYNAAVLSRRLGSYAIESPGQPAITSLHPAPGSDRIFLHPTFTFIQPKQTMNYLLKPTLLLTLVLALAGCSGKNVSIVKDTVSANPNFTYGQIFESRKFCNDTKWTSYKNDAGYTLVEYVCDSEISKDAIANNSANQIAKVLEIENGLTDKYLNSEKKAKLNYDFRVNTKQFTISDYRKRLEYLNGLHDDAHSKEIEFEKDAIDVALLNIRDQPDYYVGESGEPNSRTLQAIDKAKAVQDKLTSKKELYLAKLRQSAQAEVDRLNADASKAIHIKEKLVYVIQNERIARLQIAFYQDDVPLPTFMGTKAGFLSAELESLKGDQAKEQWEKYWIDAQHRGATLDALWLPPGCGATMGGSETDILLECLDKLK